MEQNIQSPNLSVRETPCTTVMYVTCIINLDFQNKDFIDIDMSSFAKTCRQHVHDNASPN